MKLEGEIEGRKVLVLVDSGATSNFVSTSLIHTLGKKLSECTAFGVTLGTGMKVYGDGVCKGLTLELQGITISDDFFALELGNLDVILGIQWLEKLGNMITNWRNQTMKFKWEGKEVELRGNPALKCSKISVKHLLKTMKTDELGVLIECNGLSPSETITDINIPTFLAHIIQSYPQVTQPSTQLPPKRTQHHMITLKEGSNPVSIRPYWYPHVQKGEIEKMVQDMLKVGIIQPSSSPFASPVILV